MDNELSSVISSAYDWSDISIAAGADGVNVWRGTVSLTDMPDANSELSAGDVSVGLTVEASCFLDARGSTDGASLTDGG